MSKNQQAKKTHNLEEEEEIIKIHIKRDMRHFDGIYLLRL
jgi:hypothetical protein